MAVKENNYTLLKKKEDIARLKECAKFYKNNFLGKRFLVVFKDFEYVEILFTKSEFKHLTGISSDLSTKNLFDFCIGKRMKNGNTRYITPDEIYTTDEHPRIFALKKLRVFSEISRLFDEASFVMRDVYEKKRFYRLGLANFELTLFADDTNDTVGTYRPISLKSESHLSNSSDFSKVEYVFVKANPFLKYKLMLYQEKIGSDDKTLLLGKFDGLIDDSFSNTCS